MGATGIIETRQSCPQGAILFDRARLPQAQSDWLQPSYWQASPLVDRGGRGAVWFVDGPFGAAVLRHYRRGGLVARFNRDRYLWTGEAATRSFAEFRLLARLRALDLPVPDPLLAGYWRSGISYRAGILMGRIPRARSLAQWLSNGGLGQAPLDDLAAVLARMHRCGVDHADLNAHNLLLDEQQRWWVIDFDRGRLRAGPGPWVAGKLQRLRRSIVKLAGAAGVPVAERIERRHQEWLLENAGG